MISRTHSQTHARPDEKMGRRHEWEGEDKHIEKKQANKKRRQRDYKHKTSPEEFQERIEDMREESDAFERRLKR